VNFKPLIGSLVIFFGITFAAVLFSGSTSLSPYNSIKNIATKIRALAIQRALTELKLFLMLTVAIGIAAERCPKTALQYCRSI